MIVVRITGGLGNQMFQFAFARALQARGKPVLIQWHGHRTKSHHNGWELDEVFQAPLSKTIKSTNPSSTLNMAAWFLRKTARQRESSNIGYHPGFLEARRGYLDGYWQTEKYFLALEETIRADFRFKRLRGQKNGQLQERIAAETYVSIDVRRGDYIKHPGLGNVCTPDYYANALAKLKSEHPGCIPVIFSDDIAYCHGLFPEKNAIFVDWNKGEDSWMDMALMAQCTHHIIANSSFSWWGAWLSGSPGGLTLGPENWFAENSNNSNPDIYPDHWIPVPN